MANGMGSTGTVNLTVQMMDDLIAAIDEYTSSVSSINTKVQNEIDGLIPSSFSGAAAEGFKQFYTTSVEPVIGQSTTDLMENLKTFASTVKSSIPGATDGVDDQLGEGNKSAASGAE